MKKQLLLFAFMLLPLVASAHDIEVNNTDGVTIYYNYINDGTELEVTFKGDYSGSYSDEYQGNVVIPKEVTYMDKTRKVTSIGISAFNGCFGLTSVTIPNSVTSIGNSAFYNCSGLTSITIPNSVTSIGDDAFRDCSGLTSITIPNSVTTIGSGAFYGCRGLTDVTIGNSVTSIGTSAFSGCSNIKKVIVSDLAAWCGISFANEYANPLYYAKRLYKDESTEILDLVIPDGVTGIGTYAFYGCSGLTSVTIPNSVTSIGGSAFNSCSGLTSITIPNSVTSIGNSAFYNCSGLTSITIPNSVTSIGESAFMKCSGLTDVTIGNSVTIIGVYAFRECSGLTTITIPNSVTNIGFAAFSGCSKIKKVIASDIAAWCGINFDNSSANPLCYAKHLYKDKSTEIQNLVIPDGVIAIGSNTFCFCSGLTSVTIPNSVTSIGNFAFDGCSGLTDVTIGNSVTSIGNDAFYKCSGLTSITIPNSVTSIGDRAFYDCSSLQSVYSKVEDVFTIAKNIFADKTYSDAKLYVPIGKKADYEDTPWWSNFANIEEYDYGTDAPVDLPKFLAPTIIYQGGALTVQGIDDGTQVSVYSVNGTQVGTAVVQNGQATVSTTLQSGSVAIVKIGQKSVKVLLR